MFSPWQWSGQPANQPPLARPSGACKCWPATDHWQYVRGAGKGPLSVGLWICPTCKHQVHPNPAEGTLSRKEIKRLEALYRLHSNDGWGDHWRTEGAIACSLPDPAVVD